MERLTTNKDVSEMGMFELAHNSCYCKEGAARYRDFENDIDARELTRQLLKDYADGDDAFVDDDFDEEMIELLMYGTSTTEGLIALFYRNLWAMADLREKLKEYEDLDEQGLLLRLPCKVGDTIYRVNAGAKEPVIKMRVLQVNYKQLHKDRIIIRIDAINDNDMGESCYLLEDFGKTVFLTQAEAEQKLKEMESEKHERRNTRKLRSARMELS